MFFFQPSYLSFLFRTQLPPVFNLPSTSEKFGPVKLPKEEDRRKCEGDPISWWDGSASRLCLLESDEGEAPRDGKFQPPMVRWDESTESLTAESTEAS